MIEVFVASFFVQLLALGNPLIIQVIIDKVLVQNSLPTLNVLGVLLLIVAFGEVILGGLRTYLFVDTTNRIDITLGAKIIDHLYKLPLAYFQRRRVGEIASRVGELENIRQFLTGTALTVVLDAVFSVVYVAVMLFYSVPLTLTALSTVPVLLAATFVVSPWLQQLIRKRRSAMPRRRRTSWRRSRAFRRSRRRASRCIRAGNGMRAIRGSSDRASRPCSRRRRSGNFPRC